MSKNALVLLADGFEEVEAVTPTDYLRRAGIEVTTASISQNLMVKGSHNLVLSADTTLSELAGQGRLDAASWDAVLLPGGIPGAPNLAASKEVGDFIKDMAASLKWVCAICASPAIVLSPLGILQGHSFTCFPGLEEKVSGAKWSEEKVVIDGNIITSRAAGTAAAWAIAIIGKMADKATAEKIARAVLLS